MRLRVFPGNPFVRQFISNSQAACRQGSARHEPGRHACDVDRQCGSRGGDRGFCAASTADTSAAKDFERPRRAPACYRHAGRAAGYCSAASRRCRVFSMRRHPDDRPEVLWLMWGGGRTCPSGVRAVRRRSGARPEVLRGLRSANHVGAEARLTPVRSGAPGIFEAWLRRADWASLLP